MPPIGAEGNAQMSTTEPRFTGKRIAVCMDGTWQRLRSNTPTNIAKIARSIEHESADGAKQIVVYTAGVGAANDLSREAEGALAGGLFGKGLEEDILNTYIRICLNYQWGDQLYIFGYSRGAFSARSLAGLIRRCGIVRRRFVHRAPEAFDLYRLRRNRNDVLNPDDPIFQRFRAETNKRPHEMGKDDLPPPIPIAYVGLFDTVGQRGLPSGLGFLTDLVNRRFEFHSLELGAFVQSARHAVAIDEHRFAFPPTLWTNIDELNAPHAGEGVSPFDLPYQQRWFPGAHGDIGGGDAKARLADIPLAWVVEGAERQGLAFDRSEGSPLGDAAHPDRWDYAAPFSVRPSLIRLRTRRLLNRRLGKELTPELGAALLHVATPRRLLADRRYRAPALRPFKRTFRQLQAAVAMAELLSFAAADRD